MCVGLSVHQFVCVAPVQRLSLIGLLLLLTSSYVPILLISDGTENACVRFSSDFYTHIKNINEFVVGGVFCQLTVNSCLNS